MKRFISVLAINALVIFIAFTLPSCQKLKQQLFPGFEVEPAELQFTLPVITSISSSSAVASFTSNLNMDSLIKAETMNTFSLRHIQAVTVQQLILTAADADEQNNFSNLENVSVAFHSNSNQQATVIGNAPGVPDVPTYDLTLAPQTANNIREYMDGYTFTYTISAKARRVTTKPLTCFLQLRLKIQ